MKVSKFILILTRIIFCIPRIPANTRTETNFTFSTLSAVECRNDARLGGAIGWITLLSYPRFYVYTMRVFLTR